MELKGPNRNVVRAAIKAAPFDMLATLASEMASAFREEMQPDGKPVELEQFQHKQWTLERRWRAELYNALGCWDEGDS